MTDVQQGAPPFNAADLNSVGLLEKLGQRFVDNPQWWLWLLRRFLPVLKFRNCAIITRYDDVRDALARQHVFIVPFGPKMEELNGGPNFLLGMQDGPDYRRQQALAMRVFKLDDIATRISRVSAELSRAVVANANGRLDAVENLITRIPTELCERYYGIPIADKRDFALWAIAMSAYVFDPSNNEARRRAARAGARNTWPVVDAAIREAKAAMVKPDTILGRLVALGGGPSDMELRSFLMGMVTGFVPTNTMAAGHMLEMLLRHPDFLARAQEAALADDDDLLSRCLFEAMRFKPLNLGPFRVCKRDYVVAEGTPRATTIRRNMNVLVSTQSAMFDGNRVKAPRRFDPDRPAHDYMLFGAGLHWCVGALIADAQITQMFKALLVKRNLRRVAGRDGKLTRLGPYPAHLWVQFDT